MKLLIITSTLLLMIVSTSCSKSDDSQEKLSANFSGHIDFRIEDSKGNNLLGNRELSMSDIDVIYFENDKPIVFNDPLLGAPRGFIIQDDWVRVFLNVPKKSELISETNLRIKGVIYKLISEWSMSETKSENKGYVGPSTIVTKICLGDKVIYQEGDTGISQIIIN